MSSAYVSLVEWMSAGFAVLAGVDTELARSCCARSLYVTGGFYRRLMIAPAPPHTLLAPPPGGRRGLECGVPWESL